MASKQASPQTRDETKGTRGQIVERAVRASVNAHR